MRRLQYSVAADVSPLQLDLRRIKAELRRLLQFLSLVWAACATLAACAAELWIGQATAPPGAFVSVPVAVADAPAAVAAQFDVSFNPSVVSLVDVSAGEGLASHIVDEQELTPGHWRVLVYSLTNRPVSPGAMVWLTFGVPTNAPNGAVPLGLSQGILARVDGKRVQPLAQADGALTVWSGGSFSALTLETGGQLQMQFQGAEGQRYVMEASTNLTDWAVLSTNQVTGGIVSLIETNTSAYPHRFYRARISP